MSTSTRPPRIPASIQALIADHDAEQDEWRDRNAGPRIRRARGMVRRPA
jgi:hypothetical protein